MASAPPPLVVHGGRIVDPGTGYDALGDLLLMDGRIVHFGEIPAESVGDVATLDATGYIVTPGFVDLHTHLRFPGFPEKETIESGTLAAAAGGFTTLCAMANTSPGVDCVAVLQSVKHEVSKDARVRVHQLAAVSLDLQGITAVDFDALALAGAVAFSDDGKPVWADALMRLALQASARLRKPISVHEEDPQLVGVGVANAGPIARNLGLAEWPCVGESGMVARDVALLAAEGGHLHVAHVSCAESVAIVRTAKRQGLHVTAEVTPHHLTLTDALLAGDTTLGLSAAHPCTKVNPPLRTENDVSALIEALSDGTIDAVATDHAPHATADKECSFAEAAFGFSGIELALPLVLGLVHAGRLDLGTAVARLSTGPARIFDLPGGTLGPGSAADLCIFDPDEQWTPTADAMRSRGKNTPLLGTQLRGRVRYTIVGGEIIHRA